MGFVFDKRFMRKTGRRFYIHCSINGKDENKGCIDIKLWKLEFQDGESELTGFGSGWVIPKSLKLGGRHGYGFSSFSPLTLYSPMPMFLLGLNEN